MKLFVDIPAGTLDRVTTAILRGGYRSLSDFVVMSLENQVSHELGVVSEAAPEISKPSRGRKGRERAKQDLPPSRRDMAEAGALVPDIGEVGVLEPDTEATGRAVHEHGWLLGLINRVLPIKIAARTLLELSSVAPIGLDVVRERASSAATMLAARLDTESDGSAGRDESLAIGLPTREPIFRSKERFADQFVGRIDQSGRLFGALFELGLANCDPPRSKTIGLTKAGAFFAGLRNPVLDDGSRKLSLSDEERLYYVKEVATQSQRESSCFTTILDAFANGVLTVEQLDAITREALGTGVSFEAMRNQKTAALGRLRDLGLINRERKSSEVIFSLTDIGRTSRDFLLERRRDAVTAGSQRKGK